MEVLNAREMEKLVHKELIDEKFKNMVSIQQKFIKEHMKEGKNSVVWIFNDIDYFHNDFEKCWYEEFNTRAKELFENAGYKVSRYMIRW
jgi:hypothetical protein